jgi:hypothetical protein
MSLAMPLKIGLFALSRVVMGGRDMGRRFTTTLITCGCWVPVEGNAAFASVSLLTVMVEGVAKRLRIELSLLYYYFLR